jgi:hypothetical protein
VEQAYKLRVWGAVRIDGGLELSSPPFAKTLRSSVERPASRALRGQKGFATPRRKAAGMFVFVPSPRGTGRRWPSARGSLIAFNFNGLNFAPVTLWVTPTGPSQGTIEKRSRRWARSSHPPTNLGVRGSNPFGRAIFLRII